MWFKRRKSTEQDHALSESLKSLQSLLSETGRREPSLDARDSNGDQPEVSADPPPDSREAAALKPRPDRRDDARAREPEGPDAASNRWRDLSLSFDAEPVLPKARRDGEAAAPPERDTDEHAPGAESDRPADAGVTDEAPQAPEPDVESDETGAQAPSRAEPVGDAADTGPPEPDIVTYGPAAEPVLPIRGGDTAIHGPPRPEPAAETETEGPYTAPDSDFRPRPDEEVLVLDLDAPHTPDAADNGTPLTEPSETGDAVPGHEAGAETSAREPDRGAEVDLPAPGEAASEAPLEETAAGATRLVESDTAGTPEPGLERPVSDDTGKPASDDRREEDQLRLELEATEATEADIPVLTNAVYVPETPPEPSRPVDAPHEAHIGRCIENLRARLRLMELNALSAEQEQALHDILAEFLDELDRD